MTLEEAIEQYKHIAESYDSVGNLTDAMEARQLAEWLRQARGAEKAARWYTRKIRELEDENAKLMSGYGSMSREHSQTLVELSDAYFACDQLKEENAKLRELG